MERMLHLASWLSGGLVPRNGRGTRIQTDVFFCLYLYLKLVPGFERKAQFYLAGVLLTGFLLSQSGVLGLGRMKLRSPSRVPPVSAPMRYFSLCSGGTVILLKIMASPTPSTATMKSRTMYQSMLPPILLS